LTRQAYQLPEKKLVIFWTPKAACTTVVEKIWTDYLGRTTDDTNILLHDQREWLRQSEYWVSGRDGMKLCLDEGYRSIGLVRDPYDRLISAYLNKFVRTVNLSHTDLSSLEPFARAFYLNVIGPKYKIPESAAYPGVSFRMFVEAVCDRINSREKREPMLDHHWNTQVPFFMKEAGFKYDELYKLSSADAFFKRFDDLIGVSVKKANKKNATKYGKASTNQMHDKSSLEIIDAGSISKSQFRNPEIRSIIRKSFAIDYDFLKMAL
jgi:hypothetical protein